MALKSIADIKNALNKDVLKVLPNEVQREMIDIHKDQIEIVVYSKYSPTMYQRRKTAGGLSDESNMRFRIDGKTIKLDNVTEGNPDFSPTDPLIVENIEYGKYNYYGSGLRARPFMQATQTELATSGRGTQAIAKGLRRLGYNVKK